MAGSSLIGNLAVTLGLNTAAFEQGATKAEVRAKALQGRLAGVGSSIKGIGAALGIGLGVTALAGMAKSAFDMAASLDEGAQKLGLTVEAFQELNTAATQNGIAQDSFATALSRMNKSIGALEQGSKPAAEAFAKIGISFDDLKGKSPDQQLRVIADALNKLPDVQQRVAVGSAIMGRGFSELLPLINGGSAGLDHYADVSRKNGEITTEEAKKLDELSDSWDRMKTRLGVFTAKLIATFAELADKLDASLAKWYAWRDGIIAAAGKLATDAVASVRNLVEGVRGWMTDKLNAVFDGVKSKIQAVGDAFHSLYDRVVGHSDVPDLVNEVGDWFGRLQQVMVDPALTAIGKVGAGFESLSGLISSLFGQKAGSLFGALGKLVGSIAPLFGNGLGKSLFPVVGGVDPLAPLPAMARGGGGVFGGLPGLDKNVLSLNGSPISRVSRGETWTVGAKAMAPTQVLIVPTPYFDAHVQGQAAAVAAPMAGQAAIAGASGGVMSLQKRAARTLP
jgi:hypothetical protein